MIKHGEASFLDDVEHFAGWRKADDLRSSQAQIVVLVKQKRAKRALLGYSTVPCEANESAREPPADLSNILVRPRIVSTFDWENNGVRDPRFVRTAYDARNTARIVSWPASHRAAAIGETSQRMSG